MSLYYIIGTTPNERDPDTGHPLFWHNAGGWVCRDTADIFTELERSIYSLPHNGAWIPGRAAYGPPCSNCGNEDWLVEGTNPSLCESCYAEQHSVFDTSGPYPEDNGKFAYNPDYDE